MSVRKDYFRNMAAEAEEEWEALQEDGEFPGGTVDDKLFAQRVGNMGVSEKEARTLFEDMCPTGAVLPVQPRTTELMRSSQGPWRKTSS